MSELPPVPYAGNKRGRKKGSKLALANLSSGGCGGKNQLVNDSKWTLERESDVESDSEYSESDSEKDEEVDDESDGEADELEMNCVSDLDGIRLLPIGKVVNAITNNMVCAQCAQADRKAKLKHFLEYCSEYEQSIAKEEEEKLFYSRQERLEWKCKAHKSTTELYKMYNGKRATETEDGLSTFFLAEETFGCATSLYGFCSRQRKPHKFSIQADEISSDLKKSFHHHAKGKTLALNYQLSAAIQQMGCGPADITTLCGFLGLPSKSIQYHIKEVEHVMGKIQIKKRELSEEESVEMEIAEHKKLKEEYKHMHVLL